jgi:hypothetical protein
MDSFWLRWRSQILIKALMPYLIYLCAALIYYSILLKKSTDEKEDVITSFEFWVSMIMLILGTYFFYFELRAWFSRKWSDMVTLQNVSDEISYLLMVTILIRRNIHPGMYNDEWQFWFAAISILLIWQKVLYFCKLSDTLGFYVRLLSDTFNDMIPFTFLLLIAIQVFASAFFILNRERLEVEKDAKGIYPLVFDYENELIKTIGDTESASIFAYRIGLGDFDFDGFEGTYTPTMYSLWFIGTFVINIIFFNMLIAIMGDTFDKVTEKRKEAALFEKVQILDDYLDLIRIRDID